MKLKVCGMKYNPGAVAALKPDYLGFIFWEGSPRHYAETHLPALPEGVIPVGVFVDEAVVQVLQKADRLGLGALQLHGGESPAYCRQLRGQLRELGMGSVRLIKAFSVGSDFHYDSLRPYLPHCDYFLFDTRGDLPGGTGQTFDWGVLRDYPFDKPYFLSGGIGEAQCGKLLEFAKGKAARYCAGVDVNSRFETSPGTKDTEALRRFLECSFWKECGRQPDKQIKK